MKYYEMHELVYERLKKENKMSWSNASNFEEMWLHSTNVYLEKLLRTSFNEISGLSVLDLGTGTGTSALFLARRGAKVTGVEISSSAIEIAKENAKKLGLEVEFIVTDVLGMDLRRKFDLIVDSTILHCIVGHEDRARLYDVIKRHTHQDSLLFINTRIASEDMESRFPKSYFIFRDDILWSTGIDQIRDRKEIDGKSYFPHRMIFSDEKKIEEFKRNGFEVVAFEAINNEDGGRDLVALLKRS